MHVTGAGDPLLAKLEARMPPDLTDEERAAVFEELMADDDLLDRAADRVSGPLLAQTPDVAAYVENRRSDFRRRLRWAWSRPFDLYLATRYSVVELGREFNATYRAASKLPEPLLEAMTRNLARACLVSDEVYALLEAGHRNGALARARTLHELDIVSLALAVHPHLAERYLEHHHVERYQHAKATHEAQVAQGLDPVPADELDALKATADALITRYGKTYMQPWGWAGDVLGKDTSFTLLYKEVTSAAANPDYKLVSHTIHASSFGGELVTLQTPDGEVLETGPAFGGLSDPFELALRSLVTIAVRTVEEATGADMTVFGRVGLRSIEHLADEAIASARWVDEFIEETDERFPAARFDRRRDRWAFVAIRESEYRRWQVLRLARARTEALRRAVRDLRAARKR